jgi:phosphoserine phosphatase
VISREAVALADALRPLGDAFWLRAHYAFDVAPAEAPETALAFARDKAKGVEADINLVQRAGRRKKLLAADMESTIIDCECVDEMADLAGIKPKVATITERVMRGEIEFAGALRERVALLKGLPLSALELVYRERVHFNPGARTLVATMRAHGAVTLLLSGGFTYFTDRVAPDAGFDMAQANVLLDDGTKLLGMVKEPIFGRNAKWHSVVNTAQVRGIALSDTLAVGDGANDVEMVRHAGLGVAWHPKPVLAAVAPAWIRYAGLDALLYLQGYRDEEVTRID